MAAQPVDPKSSFQHVVDQIPTWAGQIAELTTYALKRYEEYAAEYQQLVSHMRAKKQKSASISSLHGSENIVPDLGTLPQIPNAAYPSQLDHLEAGNRFIYTQARRRRPGTSLRSNASGPRAPRNKKLVVIYYDSHLQDELDKLVKSLGAARNNLRKGKLSYTASKGFILPTLSRRDNLVPNTLSRSTPTLLKASAEPSLSVIPNNIQGTFVQIDKEIERIQNWCETAAHQAIRDGDVQSEMQNSASKLDTVLAMAKSAIDTLRDESAVDEEQLLQAQTAAAGTRLKLHEGSREASKQTTIPVTKLMPSFPNYNSQRPMFSTTRSEPSGVLLAGPIEVDENDGEDDSDEDIAIDLSQFRAGSRLAP